MGVLCRRPVIGPANPRENSVKSVLKTKKAPENSEALGKRNAGADASGAKNGGHRQPGIRQSGAEEIADVQRVLAIGVHAVRRQWPRAGRNCGVEPGSTLQDVLDLQPGEAGSRSVLALVRPLDRSTIAAPLPNSATCPTMP